MPAPARAAVALALAWTLAGCTHTIRVGGGRTLQIALTEYRMTPDTVRAFAGTLTITARNLGTRTHDLVVSLGNFNEAKPLYLTPGATGTVTVDLAPGQYMLRSTVLDDQALGLWGTLDVVPFRRR
jgi:hypothetical protein